ncbi:hypothetical protein D9M73_164470 [compost metagenome]
MRGAANLAGNFDQGRLQGGTRCHVELCQPCEQQCLERARQSLLLPEIDHIEAPCRGEFDGGFADRFMPAGDHRQRIALEDAVEGRGAEQRLGVEGGGIALREHDPVGKACLGDLGARRLQHRFRNIDAVEARIGPTPGRRDQVAPSAAADFQHAAAGRRRDAFDQRIASEQIIFAGQIIDMALRPIDRIHMSGMARVDRGCVHPST